MSGCSSGVEHNLAKVGVGRSNRLTRSSFPKRSKPRFAGAFVFSGSCVGSRDSEGKIPRVTRSRGRYGRLEGARRHLFGVVVLRAVNAPKPG